MDLEGLETTEWFTVLAPSSPDHVAHIKLRVAVRPVAETRIQVF